MISRNKTLFGCPCHCLSLTCKQVVGLSLSLVAHNTPRDWGVTGKNSLEEQPPPQLQHQKFSTRNWVLRRNRSLEAFTLQLTIEPTTSASIAEQNRQQQIGELRAK